MSNPMWVDLQVNGHNGVDYSSPNLTEEEIIRSAEELYNSGTEIFLPTIITSSDNLYRRNLPLIKKTVDKYGIEKNIPGIHLEGPMLTVKGSHNPEYIQPCSAEKVQEYFDISEGFVKLMTLSADAENVVSAIKKAKKLGIVVGLGHHEASYQQVAIAANAGASVLTHLGNACPNMVGRHENPLLSGLAEDKLSAMIITDGHHLPAELIKIILRVKGSKKVIVTSDACSICGCKPGNYELWGNNAVLETNGKLHNPSKNCLVAAASTMGMCMDFLASLDILSEEELLDVGRNNALKLLVN